MIIMNRATTCAKLMSLGVPKETSSNIITDLEKWVTNNGIEWTIDHLKDVKQVFICNLAGSPPPKTKTWVARHPDGFPKGPLLATFRKSKTSGRNLTRVLTVLSSYSIYIAPQCTQRQKEKFFGSMMSTDTTGLTSTLKIIPRRIAPIGPPENFLDPFMVQCSSTTRRAPGPGLRTVPESDYLGVLQHSYESTPVANAVIKYIEIATRVLPRTEFMNKYFDHHKRKFMDTPEKVLRGNFGVISGIQEPGFKLRAVANPDRVIQAMLEPLKVLVMCHLQGLPTDHTHDQQAAIPKVQEMLRSGEVIHSVDLSDATNLFPLHLQVDLLRKMCPPEYSDYISLFSEVSSGPWLTRLRDKPEIVKFTRGQPLGLGPSFGVFALAHNTLLEGLCMKLKIDPVQHFVVLGDDVVIRGDKLNSLYRSTLANLGCKVSESKTISSTKLAEFAGTTVLPSISGKGYKWRDVSDFSFVNLVRDLGPKSMGFLHPWQRDIIDILRPVPVCLGGMGWSDGRNLTEALELPQTASLITLICNREPDGLMLFRDLIPDANRILYALRVETQMPLMAFVRPAPTRDSKVSSVWPCNMFIAADNERSRGDLRPPYVMAYPGDVHVQSYARAYKKGGDPRPSILPAIEWLSKDPQTISLVSKDLKRRLSQNGSDRVHKFLAENPSFVVAQGTSYKDIPSLRVSHAGKPKKTDLSM
jgi:hypothetical protein